MKIQDAIFVFLFSIILWRRNLKLSVVLGVTCLLLAIPLFKLWIFFTAERLTWYAAAFFAFGVILELAKLAKEKK